MNRRQEVETLLIQKEIRLAAAAKLETVLLRFHLELHPQYHWRIKSAIRWLRNPPPSR